MMAKVQVVLVPFLAFKSSYNANKVHNMLALVLDSHFKFVDVVKVFVRWEKMIQIIVEYDNKTLLPLLVVSFHFLNPTTNGFIKVTPIDDGSIFGAMTSNATALHKLLNNELGLVCHLHVKPKDFVLPLTQWKSHEAFFPNVFFVARHILRIHGFYIEIEKKINIDGMLTSLWRCRLGVYNLDKLVMIMKNWSVNAKEDCPQER
jgi:hypothetical protein